MIYFILSLLSLRLTKGEYRLPPDPIWSQLLLQVVLIAINAFFAATEIAVISLNENRLRRQAEEGDRKAAQMLRMVENSAAFLSTIQVGITLAAVSTSVIPPRLSVFSS